MCFALQTVVEMKALRHEDRLSGQRSPAIELGSEAGRTLSRGQPRTPRSSPHESNFFPSQLQVTVFEFVLTSLDVGFSCSNLMGCRVHRGRHRSEDTDIIQIQLTRFVPVVARKRRTVTERLASVVCGGGVFTRDVISGRVLAPEDDMGSIV